MKKTIVVIIILLLGAGSYWAYYKLKSENLKTAVVEHLEKQGFTSEDYSNPKYVKDKSLRGYKSNNIEIIFKNESNYTYYYIKEGNKIQILYAKNQDTGEANSRKKEP